MTAGRKLAGVALVDTLGAVLWLLPPPLLLA